MADEEQVQSSTEETTEVVEETTEKEAETSEEISGEADGAKADGADKHQKAFEDQKRRAEKAETEAKRLRDLYEPKKETRRAPKKDDEALSNLEKRVARAELTAIGINTKEQQDFVFGAAQRLGIDPVEAANDPIVVAKLETMREVAATKEATPAPSKGGGTARKAKNAWDLTDEEFAKETSRIMSNRV